MFNPAPELQAHFTLQMHLDSKFYIPTLPICMPTCAGCAVHDSQRYFLLLCLLPCGDVL